MTRKEIIAAVIRGIDIGGYPGQSPYRETLAELILIAFDQSSPKEPELREALTAHYGDERDGIRFVLERWALWWELLAAGREGKVFRLQRTPRM